jgi:hypothetical protein
MLPLKAKLVSAIVVGFFAAGAQAGIVGSKHDFSSYGWSKNQICLPCHAPHAAGGENQTYKAGILWNHTLTTKTKGLTFNVYSSSNSAPTGGTTDLDPNSILCMSCHDGTVALDSFGGATGTQMMTDGLKGANGDLTGNHPVGTDAAYPTDATGKLSTRTSFVDPQDLGKGGYRISLPKVDVTTTTNGVTTTTSKYLVGCGTCHNPHNGLNQAKGEGMLRVPQRQTVTVGGTSALSNGVAASLRPAGATYTVPGSGLCLTCHIK